jgi:hypothetical protein
MAITGDFFVATDSGSSRLGSEEEDETGMVCV